MPRLFLTESLAEKGEFGIDPSLKKYNYRKQMDLSRSFCVSNRILEAARTAMVKGGLGRPVWSGECREEVHPNKAPAQSIVGVPFYLLGRGWAVMEGEHYSPKMRLWWLRLGTSIIPMFLLLFLMGRLLKCWVNDPHPRRVALIAYALGSLAMVYGLQLMSHGLAAFFLFAAFYFLCSGATDRGGVSAGEAGNEHHSGGPAALRLVFSGICGGMAIASDYQAGFGVVILSVYGVYKVGLDKKLVWGLLGGAVPLFFLGLYHYYCYGSPFWTGYDFLIAGEDHGLHAQGFMGIVGPQKKPFWATLFSARDGLIFLSPWTLFVVLGLYGMLKRKTCAATSSGFRSSLWKICGGLIIITAGLIAVYRGAGVDAAPWTDRFLEFLGLGVVAWALFGIFGADYIFKGREERYGCVTDMVLGCVVIACGILAPVLAAFTTESVWVMGLPLLTACWGFVGVSNPAESGDEKRWGRKTLYFGVLFILTGVVYFLVPPGFSVVRSALRLFLWLYAALWVVLGARGKGDAHDREDKDGEGKDGEGSLPHKDWEEGTGAQLSFGVPEALVLFAMVSFYIWFVVSVTFWHGGWQVGPRYLAVMLPFLTLGAAVAFGMCWVHGPAWILVASTVAVGMVVYMLTSATFPHFPKSFINPLYDLVGYLLERGYVADNAGRYLVGWGGLFSLWPYLLVGGIMLLYMATGSFPWNWAGKRTVVTTKFPVTKKAAVKNQTRFRDPPFKWVFGVLGICAAVFVLEYYRALPRADFQKCCGWITKMWDAELRVKESDVP